MKTEQASPEFIRWFKKELDRLTPTIRAYVKTGQQVPPAMVLFPALATLKTQILPVGDFFGSGNVGKDVIAMLHQQIATDEEVKAVMVINEVWTMSTDKDVDMKKSLEHEPGREEAIMFNCIMKNMQLIATYKITRPDNTMPDEPTRLLDPMLGIIEGADAHPGIFGGATGRMIIEPDKH